MTKIYQFARERDKRKPGVYPPRLADLAAGASSDLWRPIFFLEADFFPRFYSTLREFGGIYQNYADIPDDPFAITYWPKVGGWRRDMTICNLSGGHDTATSIPQGAQTLGADEVKSVFRNNLQHFVSVYVGDPEGKGNDASWDDFVSFQPDLQKSYATGAIEDLDVFVDLLVRLEQWITEVEQNIAHDTFEQETSDTLIHRGLLGLGLRSFS